MKQHVVKLEYIWSQKAPKIAITMADPTFTKKRPFSKIAITWLRRHAHTHEVSSMYRSVSLKHRDLSQLFQHQEDDHCLRTETSVRRCPPFEEAERALLLHDVSSSMKTTSVCTALRRHDNRFDNVDRISNSDSDYARHERRVEVQTHTFFIPFWFQEVLASFVRDNLRGSY